MTVDNYTDLLVRNTAVEITLTQLPAARPRRLLIAGIVSAYAFLVFTFFLVRDLQAILFSLFLTIVAAVIAMEYREERSIIEDQGKAVGTVVELKQDGGRGARANIKYAFLSAGNELYFGKTTIGRNLLNPIPVPKHRDAFPVLYKRSNPGVNRRLADFWLFEFPNSGPRPNQP